MARAKPHVPDALWPWLLTARSLAAGSVVVGLPASTRTLVLVAHPDDEALACGGTIALLAAAGTEVEVVSLTDGDATIGSGLDPAETGRRRRGEQATAAALLGASLTSIGLPDGALGDRGPDVVAAVAGALDRVRPDLVLCPWPADGHPDHRAVAHGLAGALAGATALGSVPAELQVWGCEAWTALPHNRLVDITGVVDAKRAAVEAHATARLAFDLSAGLGLSRWRSVHGTMGEGWAEAFLATDPAGWVELCGAVRDLPVDAGWAGPSPAGPPP